MKWALGAWEITEWWWYVFFYVPWTLVAYAFIPIIPSMWVIALIFGETRSFT